MKKIQQLGQMNFGLKDTPKDDRDKPFHLGAVIQQIDIAEVRKTDWDFSVLTVIKNQGPTQRCTGYATSEVSEDQENVELCPDFQAAAGFKIAGVSGEEGTDLRSVAKGAIKTGCLPVKFCSHCKSDDKYNNKWNDLKSWPQEEINLAYKYRKKSFIWVDKGRYDTFGNILTALWQNKKKCQSVLTGTTWRENWTHAEGGIIPIDPGDIAGGHAIKKCIAYKMIEGKGYLVIQNSYDKTVGDNGLYYVPAEVVNRDFTYGAIQFIDADPEEIKQSYQQIIKENINKTIMTPKSNLFEINLRDLTNGLLVAVLGAVLTYLQKAFADDAAITMDDLKVILNVALASGLGYLIKNFFETPQGDNKITGAVKNMFKK